MITRTVQALTWGLLAPLMAVGTLVTFRHDRFAMDAHAYWVTRHGGDLYGLAPGKHDAYLYSPAFAQLIHPLVLLPWVAFAAIWTALLVAATWWLVRPLDWGWQITLLLLSVPALINGNVFPLFAVVLVAGGRYPLLWAFPLLTKIVPGMVGFAWFAGVRDFRRLAIAIVGSLGIVAGSAAVNPGAWADWFSFLTSHQAAGLSTLAFGRYALGAALVAVAVLTRWRWLLAPALLASCPMGPPAAAATILLAIPRLRLQDASAGVRIEMRRLTLPAKLFGRASA